MRLCWRVNVYKFVSQFRKGFANVGLQLDEAPVVAQGFDRPMPLGGTMAIEPKVVHPEGCIGSEDTWTRDEGGLRPLTAGGAWPWITTW